MKRGAGIAKALIVAALLVGACTATTRPETRQEHAERLLKARFGDGVIIQNLDVSGKVTCGWSSQSGIFLIDGEEVVSGHVDPDRLRDCGPDFAGAGPTVYPVE